MIRHSRTDIPLAPLIGRGWYWCLQLSLSNFRVCFRWSCPQETGDVVVGNAQQLAKGSKGSQGASVKGAGVIGAQALPAEVARAGSDRAGASEAEGLFAGMKRVSVPRGAVMMWNGAEAESEL